MDANGNDHENVDNGSNVNHGSTLIDMLDIDRPVPTEADNEADRRYTAAEKGKGRAGRTGRGREREKETITIDDEEEEEDSIQITGMKRKAVVESEEEEEGGDEDETRLGAFSESISSSYTITFVRNHESNRYPNKTPNHTNITHP